MDDFKRAYNKIYFDFSASTLENFRVADLMIKDMRLLKKIQTNVFFDNDFVKSFSVIANRVDIIKINTSTFSIRTIVSKFFILKIVSVTSRKTLQIEKIDQSNKSNVVSFAVNSISFQIRFFNLDKKILAASIN